MEKIIFNSSMPKSGSELLQVVLNQNPKIYGSPTSPLLEFQYAARGNLNLPEVKSQDQEIMQSAFISMCGGMAKYFYDPITNKPIVCDKNRGWSHYYEWVEQWNLKPKMICMVRDLKSIIASMEKTYRKTRHLPAGPDNPAELRNMTLHQRVEYWLNTQPIGLALLRTLDLFQRNINEKILFVRYEDFCENPEKELKRVYEYISEEYYEEHYFTGLKKENQEDSSFFGVYGFHDIKPDIIAPKENNWRKTLTKESGQYIDKDQLWYQETFGY